MRILITGGSGFIGRNLSEAMSGRFDILAPSHAELELLDSDAVERWLRENRVDAVVHSAIRPGHRNAPDPTGQTYANTRMFFNLARCRDLFGRLVFLGSGAVYDQEHYVPKMPESYFDSHVPADEIGFSKYVIAKQIECADAFTELRVFGVFGKYEDYAIRFISNAICKALFDLPITIKMDRRFDYLAVQDLTQVVEYFLTADGRHRAYNVTPDASVSLLDIAELVRSISGKDLEIRVGAPGQGAEYSGDNTRLRAELTDLRLTPLARAVQELYDWYEEHRATVDRSRLLFDK